MVGDLAVLVHLDGEDLEHLEVLDDGNLAVLEVVVLAVLANLDDEPAIMAVD